MALPLFIAVVILFARECASWDHEEIVYRIRTGGESLDHGPMWWFRAFMVGLLSVPAAHFMGNWLALMPLLLIGAFGFSAVFRYRLNKLRGLDWRYVAPWSNYYDRVWYAIACRYWFTKGMLRSHRILLKDYHKSTISDGSDIHRAGTIAYITELTITTACIVWAITLTA
jgi:hypothetical protein